MPVALASLGPALLPSFQAIMAANASNPNRVCLDESGVRWKHLDMPRMDREMVSHEERERMRQWWAKFKVPKSTSPTAAGSTDRPPVDGESSPEHFSQSSDVTEDSEGGESEAAESDEEMVPPKNLFDALCGVEAEMPGSESEDSESEETLKLSPHPKPLREAVADAVVAGAAAPVAAAAVPDPPSSPDSGDSSSDDMDGCS